METLQNDTDARINYDDMDGHDFERFCADVLRSNGFDDVEVTSGSGDYGVDILAVRDGVTYAIQCKRQEAAVGNKAVQEIFSGKDFYKRHVGVVLTNQYFTPSAVETAERTGIVLWDRDKLDEFVARANNEGQFYSAPQASEDTNESSRVIPIGELLESPEWQANTSPTAFIIGRDIAGNAIIGDMKDLAHLLIAGMPDSGKTTCINTVIYSIISRTKPEDVKLYMVDAKILGRTLRHYNGIPHLLEQPAQSFVEAMRILQKATFEMDDRYRKLEQGGFIEVDGYNAANPDKALPRIIIIIDEMADLMMTDRSAAKYTEKLISRIAQKARACGIHLILATQRPDVKILPDSFKFFIPSRIALRVRNRANSQFILDVAGAEKLRGNGDMLYCPCNTLKPIRVQGCWTSEDDIDAMVMLSRKEQAEREAKAAEEKREIERQERKRIRMENERLENEEQRKKEAQEAERREQERIAEGQRILEEQRRLEEEEKRREQERLAEEQRIIEEQRRLEEEKKRREQERLAEEQRIIEAEQREQERIEEEQRRKEAQSYAWKSQGLCPHCGGKIGVFGKCKICKRKG